MNNWKKIYLENFLNLIFFNLLNDFKITEKKYK